MYVRLVPDVEKEFIGGKIEREIKGKGEFHHAQVGGQMPPVRFHRLNDGFPDLRRQRFQFGYGTRLQRLTELLG